MLNLKKVERSYMEDVDFMSIFERLFEKMTITTEGGKPGGGYTYRNIEVETDFRGVLEIDEEEYTISRTGGFYTIKDGGLFEKKYVFITLDDFLSVIYGNFSEKDYRIRKFLPCRKMGRKEAELFLGELYISSFSEYYIYFKDNIFKVENAKGGKGIELLKECQYCDCGWSLVSTHKNSFLAYEKVKKIVRK